MVYSFLSFYATSSYLTFSHLISFLLPILFPIFHHIQYHFSHPLIFNVPLILLLLPLILAHVISSHTTTSYPTLSILFLLYHFHSSSRLSGCPILFLVILFCFLPPHILSYLLCTLFSLFTSYVVPACLLPLSLILHHLIYAISYVLSCFTTISRPVPLLFPTYLDHIQCHFHSSFITSSHVVRIPLIISYFLSLWPTSFRPIPLPMHSTSFHPLLLTLILSYFLSSSCKPTFCHFLSCFTTSTPSILLHLFLSYFLSFYTTFLPMLSTFFASYRPVSTWPTSFHPTLLPLNVFNLLLSFTASTHPIIL